MTDRNDSANQRPEGKVSRRDALKGAAAAAGFVTLGLKKALADSRVIGKPVLANDCRALNALVPTAPGPEFDRLLQDGILDPKGFLKSHFSLTQAQLAKIDGTSPADVAAIQGALRTAQQKNLAIHFDCGAPATPGAEVLHSSANLHISTLIARGAISSQKIAPGAKTFGGTLNIGTPAAR